MTSVAAGVGITAPSWKPTNPLGPLDGGVTAGPEPQRLAQQSLGPLL